MKIPGPIVIELIDDNLQSVQAFSDGYDGRIQARSLFASLAKKHGARDDELEYFTADGYYETSTYQLFLACSYGD